MVQLVVVKPHSTPKALHLEDVVIVELAAEDADETVGVEPKLDVVIAELGEAQDEDVVVLPAVETTTGPQQRPTITSCAGLAAGTATPTGNAGGPTPVLRAEPSTRPSTTIRLSGTSRARRPTGPRATW